MGSLGQQLHVLGEAMRSFVEVSAEPARLFATVARRTSEVLGGFCLLRLVSEDGDGLRAVAAHDDDADVIALLRKLTLEGRAGAPLLMASISEPELRGGFSDPGDQEAAVALAVKSVLIVPLLRAPASLLGALSVVRHGQTSAAFDDDDVALAQSLADHAALAISNARHLSELKREAAERAQSDSLLQASRQELADRTQTDEVLRRAFLEAAPDSVLIVNAKGEIVLVNSQTERVFGYARAELQGQPIEMLVPERFRARHPGHRHGYVSAPLTRPMGAGLNLFAVRKDGTEFAAEISLSPIETPEGTLVAAAIRDVTERRRDMEERNIRMQEANRIKSEFLANMSHELRTPLNAIIGFAALMHAGKAGTIADLHKEYLGDILTSSRHLLQLINDILDLAKVETGRVELRVETVELATIVAEVKDILRGLASERRVRLSVDIDTSINNISVDVRMLKQILYNYLSNAIKFTDEGGLVSLRVNAAGDDTFRIDVEDTGIGIKPEDMKRLFIEFQQLDSGAAKKYPGTGLGLALTKRIVEAQRGRVAVTSVPGQGSVFSAVLPRDVGAATTAPPERP
jgi:protein-histidine pros-kinase